MAIGSYKLDSRWINGRQPSKAKGGGLKKNKRRRRGGKNERMICILRSAMGKNQELNQ